MFAHKTVLLKETVDGLHIKPDGIYIDCTLGGGVTALICLSSLPAGIYTLLTRMKRRFSMPKKSLPMTKTGSLLLKAISGI